MTIYHFNDEKEQIINVLSKKKFLIMDLFDTLTIVKRTGIEEYLEGVERKENPDSSKVGYIFSRRDGATDFLEFYKQEKIIFTDARYEEAIETLSKTELLRYFSHVYSSNDLVDAYFKDYEAIPQKHGYSIDESIVFEDLGLQMAINRYTNIDFVIIPLVTGLSDNPLINKFRNQVKNNEYSFKDLIP